MDASTRETNVQNSEPSQGQAARARALTALAHLEHGHRDAMEELRVAICEYVGALRRQGASRDDTLASIRALIATPATPEGGLALTPIVRDALAELTLQWCVAEYDRLAAEMAG
ncbi:MAG TPA: hypothetical protein VH080_02140 [Gemmatimonadaceae bacterium]|jgi:hypothetical protein|nr:hypothetical protein [Gemmatimonadaceae bacterium]